MLQCERGEGEAVPATPRLLSRVVQREEAIEARLAGIVGFRVARAALVAARRGHPKRDWSLRQTRGRSQDAFPRGADGLWLTTRASSCHRYRA